MRKQNQAHAVDSVLRKWSGFTNHALRQSPSPFHPLHVIHGHQSLQRCISALPPGADYVTRRSIERIHVRQRRHTFYVRVHAAAVEGIAVLLGVMYSVAGWITYLLPNARRLVRLDAGST